MLPVFMSGKLRAVEAVSATTGVTTWRGVDDQDAAVWIREIRRSEAGEPRWERFSRECKVLGDLTNRALPTRLACDPAEGLLVRAWVEGRPLSEAPQPQPEEVLDIVRRLARVLSWLHSLAPPVVHDGIAPEHVIRAPGGHPVLIGLGSRALARDGEPATPASDVYALGVLAAALMTRSAPEDLRQRDGSIRWQPPTWVHADVREVVDQMLDPRPAKRPHAAEVAAVFATQRAPTASEIAPAVKVKPAVAPPPSDGSSTGLMVATVATLVVAAGVVVMALLVLGWLAFG